MGRYGLTDERCLRLTIGEGGAFLVPSEDSERVLALLEATFGPEATA